MIRYSAVLLFVCVSLLNSAKAQVETTSPPGNCADNGYLDFFRCMIQCYEEQYGVTGLIEEDHCTNGVQVIIEGSGGDSFTVKDVKEAIQCVTGKCQSTVPPSQCGDDSSSIVKNLPDDIQDSIIQDLNAEKYDAAEGELQTESRKHHSKYQRSHSRKHVSKKTTHHHKEKHRRIHKRKHLLKKLADAYGIKGDQYKELLAKLRKASGTQEQTDTSGDQSGDQEDDMLTKLVEDLKGRKGASGVETTQVQKLLAKLVEASGAQNDQDNAAASDLLSKLLETSGLQIGQLNELLKTLEEVSGKNTEELKDVSGILADLMDDSGEDTDELDSSKHLKNKDGGAGKFDISSRPKPGIASGPQSKSIASAVGPQSNTVASASGPVSNGLAPADEDNLDDCEEPDGVESDDSRSPTRNAVASVTGTGNSSGGSNTDSNPEDGSIDDCYETDDNPVSAVAVASSDSNSAKSSVSGLERTNDYYRDIYDDYYNSTYDYYDNSTYDYYDNSTYDDYDNSTYDDYGNSSFANISYFYDDYSSSQVPLTGGSPNVFAVVQEGNLNSDNKQYQSINVESGSASIGGVQINQNPIVQSYQTNAQNTGGILPGGGQNKGILPNTFSPTLGFNQNPIYPGFPQTQGVNPILQNQGNSNSGGAIVTSGQTPNQFVNSFMQGQGFYPNPSLQQYKNNQYGSGVANNQQPFSQFPNTPLQPPFVNNYPSNGASVGTIYFAGSGNSGQMQQISANTPVQNQAFRSNIWNGPFLNIPQTNGFAGQASSGGSNPSGALSSVTTGAVSGGGISTYSQVPAGNNPVPSQSGIFGPYLNSPQINGGGINSAGNSGSAIAGALARNSGQNQGTSGNVPVQSQFYNGGSLGNIPVLNIPQYYGNSAQNNGGGIQQIARGAGASNFASSFSNNGANSAYQGYNSGPVISINSQSFGGNIPTNQGAVPSSGNSASQGNLANFRNPANSGNSGSLVNGGSSANSASFGNTRSSGNAASFANTGSSGNAASFANTASSGNAASFANTGGSGNAASFANTGGSGNAASFANTGSSGNSASFANTGSSGNVGNFANLGNTGYAGSLANGGSVSSAISSANVQSFAM